MWIPHPQTKEGLIITVKRDLETIKNTMEAKDYLYWNLPFSEKKEMEHALYGFTIHIRKEMKILTVIMVVTLIGTIQ